MPARRLQFYSPHPNMTQITSITLQFFKDIQKNNNREWFLKNKDRYLNLKKELEEFAAAWHHEIAAFDDTLRSPDEKGYVFRIYRDARFAKGAPYKTGLGILVVKGGRPKMHERAGYYLNVEPNNCFLAGGCYLPPSAWLQNIRQAIAEDAKPFKAILNSSSFKKTFTLEGDKLKTAPRDFPKDHPEIELLRHKSFMAMHRLSDKEVLAPSFLKNLTQMCKALQPFDNYLNQLI